MNAHELIDRYIDAVGKHLPGKNRQDVQKELRSLLLDALEERAGLKEPTIQHAADMLGEFGPPEKMAAQYHSSSSLIGESLLPTYILVLKIASSVISVLYLVILAFLLWQGNSAEYLSIVTNWLTEYVNRILTIIGGVTLAFVALERLWGGSIAPPEEAAWDPMSLPPVNDPMSINRYKLATSIIAGFVGVGVFALLISPGGVLRPIFADEFMPLLPWLIASTGVELILKVLVLARGQWTRTLRWLEIAQHLFALYVVWLVITGGKILAFTGVPDPVKLGFGVAFVVIVIELLIKFGRIILNRTPATGWKTQSTTA